MAEFSEVAEKIRQNVGQAYGQDELQSLLAGLENAGGAIADELESCTDGTHPGFDNGEYDGATECIQDVSSSLSGQYQSQWRNNRQAKQILGAAASAAWDQQARNAASMMAKDANIDSLNKDCMDGNYSSVESEIGESVPQNAADCMDVVADAQGISGQDGAGSYSSAWQ